MSVIQRLKNWLAEVVKWLKDSMTPWTKEEASKVTLDDFVNMTLKDFADGRNVAELAGVKGQCWAENITNASELEEMHNPIQFLVGRKRREEMERRLEKRRPDITQSQREALFGVLDGIGDVKIENATFGWFLNGSVRLPEDMDKIRQAVDVAGKAGVDPMRYKSPMELLEAHSEFYASEDRINPDDVPTLHKEHDYGNGIVTYNVDESDESRENIRRIINTHINREANPWCVAQGDGKGNLSENAGGYWRHYGILPKRVAFRNGKLLAFFASDDGVPTWWDRWNTAFDGIPVRRKMDDGSGRSASYVFDETTHKTSGPKNITLGDKKNGPYEEWYDAEHPKVQRAYKDGEPDGERKEWFKNGQLMFQCTYKDGKLDGEYKEWYENGLKK